LACATYKAIGRHCNVGSWTAVSTDECNTYLIAINASLGLDIDASTARTRWAGERLDHSHAIEAMYFEKHGQL